ncbi:hypothetical protein P2318_19270 [Myxococcaceae bacterium GXIMD 01537]
MKLCACAPVRVSWETTGTHAQLGVDPETTPPASGPVRSADSRTLNICQDTRVTLSARDEDGRNEKQAQVFIERVTLQEQPMVLLFEPLCSGPRFLGWRALGNLGEELPGGMRVREVLNTGSQDILSLTHEGVVENNLFAGGRTGRFRDTPPESIWDATTVGRGNCPGSERPEPGEAPPPQVTVMVGCGE